MGQAKNRGTFEGRKAASIAAQPQQEERTCETCKHRVPLEEAPEAHCYMFREKPEDYCAQHCFPGESLKAPGKLGMLLGMLGAIAPDTDGRS